MRGQVVQDDDVAALETGKELRHAPADEVVVVRRLKHRAQQNPPRKAHCAEQCEVLAPVHRRALDELLPPSAPRVRPRHRGVQTRLVEENESFDREPAHHLTEGVAFGNDVWAQLFERSQPFFFTTYPPRCSARLMLDACRRALPLRPRLYAAVISAAVASPSRSRISSIASSATSEGIPPPRFSAAPHARLAVAARPPIDARLTNAESFREHREGTLAPLVRLDDTLP